MGQVRFYGGCKVLVKDTPSMRSWNLGDEAIGTYAYLTEDEANDLNLGGAITLWNNELHINFEAEDLELVPQNWDS